MEKEVLITAENVGKRFCKDLKRSLWYGVKDLASTIQGKDRSDQLRKDEFWAVQNINFEVRRGECLGLLGHNGAGKSTLLKMLNGLIRPDTGDITMRGRVGALIELGAGFNPILTGRENIYNNAAILGFTKKETNAKFDEIVEFSEISEFLDMPVQNYSSGMRVRLGFAVAAQMEPDILLIDEVLAVGDMGFVLKCFNQMDKQLNKTAMIFVSHSMPQIARMSTKILVMEKGKELILTENISEGIGVYYNKFTTTIGSFIGEGIADLEKAYIQIGEKHFDDDTIAEINYLDPLELHIKIKCNETIDNPSISLAFYDKEQRIFAEVSGFSQQVNLSEGNEKLHFSARFDQIPFNQGRYSITIIFTQTKNGVRETIFRAQNAVYFFVKSHRNGWAPIQFIPEWKMIES